MTDKNIPILNTDVIPTLGDGHCFYLYKGGDIVSLVPAWEGITVEDIRALVEEQPEGSVDAVYVPFLHEQKVKD